MYNIEFHKRAQRDMVLINRADPALKKKVQALIEVLRLNPYSSPPPYEKLIGDLADILSRRINIQHRLLYTVNENTKTVRVLRMWTHYEQ